MIVSTQKIVRTVSVTIVMSFIVLAIVMACNSRTTFEYSEAWKKQSILGADIPSQSDTDSFNLKNDDEDPKLHNDAATEHALGDYGYVADEMIVAFNKGAQEEDALLLAVELDADLIEWIPDLNAARFRLGIPDEKLPSAVRYAGRKLISGIHLEDYNEVNRFISKAESNPAVKYAEPHYFGQACATAVTPNDPRYPEQYYIPGIKANYVWSLTTGSPEVTIAIIDSGVDYDHPEFVGRIHPAGKDFISPPLDSDPGLRGDGGATPGNGLDDDGDNFTDDGAQHGSRTAGACLAMGNNGEGIAGVNWQSKILSLRVDSLVGEINGWLVVDCVRAMMYALKFPEVKVINISAVYPRSQQLLRDATLACYEAGKVVVASAGNAGVETPILSAPAYFPECIAVGGTSGISSIWSGAGVGTNFGSYLDILAPATNVMTVNSNGVTRTYSAVTGTSLSAPLISGLAALIIADNPHYTPNDVDKAIKAGALSFDEKYPELAGKLGVGLVNCLTAFESPPQVHIEISSARSDGLTFFELQFNRKLDPISATNVEHYSLSPSSYIYGAVLLADKQTVRIETEPLAEHGYYTVNANSLITADGEVQYPDVLQAHFTADPISFNAASSRKGAISYATSEFSESYVSEKAIDDYSLSYWCAEIPEGGVIDYIIKFPRLEWVNSLTIGGRKKALSEPAYRQICKIYATPVYSSPYTIMEESYTVINDPSVMTDNKLTMLGDSLFVINFPLIKTSNIVVRFHDGNDFKHDSDGKSNGVSIRWIKARRELTSGDYLAPVVYRISPNSAPLGATVELTGANFGTLTTGSKVVFGDIEAIILLWADNRILTLVPYNPLSLPTVTPKPVDAYFEGLSGDPTPEPETTNAIIPPFQNAESGDVCVLMGDYQSNRFFFEVRTP